MGGGLTMGALYDEPHPVDGELAVSHEVVHLVAGR